MTDIKSLPYAGWLEDMIKSLAETEPENIAMAAKLRDGTVLTAYYMADMTDKVILAENIRMDAVFEMAKANARAIVEAAEEDEEES